MNTQTIPWMSPEETQRFIQGLKQNKDTRGKGAGEQPTPVPAEAPGSAQGQDVNPLLVLGGF